MTRPEGLSQTNRPQTPTHEKTKGRWGGAGAVKRSVVKGAKSLAEAPGKIAQLATKNLSIKNITGQTPAPRTQKGRRKELERILADARAVLKHAQAPKSQEADILKSHLAVYGSSVGLKDATQSTKAFKQAKAVLLGATQAVAQEPLLSPKERKAELEKRIQEAREQVEAIREPFRSSEQRELLIHVNLFSDPKLEKLSKTYEDFLGARELLETFGKEAFPEKASTQATHTSDPIKSVSPTDAQKQFNPLESADPDELQQKLKKQLEKIDNPDKA